MSYKRINTLKKNDAVYKSNSLRSVCLNHLFLYYTKFCDNCVPFPHLINKLKQVFQIVAICYI